MFASASPRFGIWIYRRRNQDGDQYAPTGMRNRLSGRRVTLQCALIGWISQRVIRAVVSTKRHTPHPICPRPIFALLPEMQNRAIGELWDDVSVPNRLTACPVGSATR